MSKLNEVHVYGFLQEPEIEYEGETPVACAFKVQTVRRKAGSILEQYTPNDEILFYTRERDKINTMIVAKERLHRFKENIPIEIYGNLVTRQAEASLKCKECGEEFNARVFITYVRPTAINTFLNKARNSPFLLLMREKSNSVNLIGVVTKEPFMLNNKEMTVDAEGNQLWVPVDSEEAVFPLAISRNYAVIEDLDNTTDYPLIAAKTLETELDYIQTGASILVRGSIWNKKVNRVLKCTHCKAENQFQDEVTLVFPYNVEFLFSSKNKYAIGAAMKTFSDDMEIHITKDGETVTRIAKKAYLLEPEYAEARKALYPKTIKRIIPKGENKIELEIDNIIDIEDEQELVKIKKEVEELQAKILKETEEKIKIINEKEKLKDEEKAIIRRAYKDKIEHTYNIIKKMQKTIYKKEEDKKELEKKYLEERGRRKHLTNKINKKDEEIKELKKTTRKKKDG